MEPTKDFPEPHGGHQPMEILYNCPECNHWWDDQWCSAVDGECPNCETKNISPVHWDLINSKGNVTC